MSAHVRSRPVIGGSRRRDYFPALDGLRAVAVLTVVVFHAGVQRAQGGFLGVSLFFTLSGFLITRLLIAEHADAGRIALRAFWGRRVRRLAPAALVCLAAVVVGSYWLVSAVQMRTLRGDVIAAAANVANWRFLSAGQSYASLFAGRPSPVLHFWSLAIEEQFYLVFPCLMALLFRFRRRFVLPLTLLALVAGSLAVTLATADHDAIYYGTHTRAAELLIGALLAWVMSRPAPARLPRVAREHPRVLLAAAVASAVVFAVLVGTTAESAGWLYRGGFVAVAVLWCPLIVASIEAGPFARALGVGPLAAIGRRSYGIYVFHWPVFAMVTPSVLGLAGWQARLVQVLIIAAATEVSFRIVERPIRERRILQSGSMMRITALTAIAVVVVAAVVVPAEPTPAAARISMLDAPDEPTLLTPSPAAQAASLGPTPSTIAPAIATNTATNTATGSGAGTTAPSAAPARLRIVVIGSAPEVVTALRTAAADRADVDIVDAVRPDCPVVVVGPLLPPPATCAPPPAVPAGDLVVLAVGRSDHDAFAQRIVAAQQQSIDELYRVTQQLDQAGVAAFVQAARVHGSITVVDADETPRPSRDFLDTVLAEASVSSTGLTVHRLPEVGSALLTRLTATLVAPPAANLRVMVIGDSTSYGVARGLADSGQAIDVLWAGKRNCPLIPMEAIVLIGTEYSMGACPTVRQGWPEALASFHPDVVLAVDSLPEESLQRYAGDSAWHAPGDPQFIAAHNAGLRDLLDLLAPTGAVLEVADAPFNAPDAPAEWTTDEHISAWNGQIVSWDAQWSVVEAIGYAGLIRDAEAAAGHTLRPDGAHLDDASVTAIIGGQFAPLLVQQVAALRARMQSWGCIVTDPSGPTLNLERCR